MKKKQSIIVLILSLVMTVLLGLTVVRGWGPTGTGSMGNIRTGLDLSGGVSITFQATEENPSQEDMSDTVNKLEQRVQQYSNEALVYQQGANRISVEIPGATDANSILEELGKPGSLQFVDEDGNVVLDGSDIAGAEGVARVDQTTGQREYVVELSMTAEGTTKFAEATTANLNKTISIVYDGETVSSPTVNSAITDGQAVIEGMSGIEEAKNLASTIRIGALSLELKEVYSNVVGAQLGQDALESSVIAGVIGLLIVCVFMIFVYRISGLAAAWALVIFAFLDLIFLNAFDITLTLPGIAGVVLTIGMAVDANVIIFERFNEELRAGRGIRTALRTGFKNAMSAILDANVTTLIAAIVLMFFGTGSIQGFAKTLLLGVVVSMLSAVVITRFLMKNIINLGVKDKRMFAKLPVAEEEQK